MILTKITEPTQLDCAYAAGLFDGEGCASITRRRRKSGQWLYSASLIVANTDREMLEWLGERWGGAMHPRSVNVRHQASWNWVLSGYAGPAAFLRSIQPFVRSKAGVLQNVSEMMRALQEVYAARGRGTSREMWEVYEQLYACNRELNRRGTPPGAN